MFSSKKPYSAITVQIDRLTSEQFEEDDFSGIIDLIEVIRIQASGPTEAARAIRKKLKYGNPHRQIRALVILDGLIQNAGSRFQRAFADEPLLERLRILARDDVADAQVRQKCKVLFIQWANAYKSTAGLERIAVLYKELPKSSRPVAARQKVLQDDVAHDSDGDHSPSPTQGRSRASSSVNPAGPAHRPVTLTPTNTSFTSKLSKSKNKERKQDPFNLAKEKDNMTSAIAKSSMASINLLNGLQLVNRETERVSENEEVQRRFKACKQLRREILRYIQFVESDEWIGSLVNANDELVKALTAYEIMDRSVDDDSDSDAWEHAPPEAMRPQPPTGHVGSSDVAEDLRGLSMNEAPPSKPPRPGAMAMPPPPAFPSKQAADTPEEEEDENDPFGDSNAVATPAHERSGMTWKEV
ncbi:hypothetical protein Q7P37_000416 [Cladosporium fusiforme]